MPSVQSSGIVEIKKAMLKAMRLGQMLSKRPHPPTLGCVVATGHVHHTTLSGQMGLRLGDFTRDEDLRTGLNGRLKIPLRAASAPCNHRRLTQRCFKVCSQVKLKGHHHQGRFIQSQAHTHDQLIQTFQGSGTGADHP